MSDIRELAPSPTAKGQPRSIPSLDGLRGGAVLLVIASHFGMPDRILPILNSHRLGLVGRAIDLDWGDLGVSVFFVISGFLITTLLTRKGGGGSLRIFYIRRFFRIFPPYYVFLLIIGLLWAAGAVPMVHGAFFSALLYISNYFPYTRSMPGTYGWLVGHTWSLSLEEQFYLVWPFVLRQLGRRRAIWVGVALVLASPLLRLLTLHLAPWTIYDDQIDRMFHTRMDTIMVGCVLALLEDWPKIYAGLMRAIRHPASAMLATGLLWVVVIESKLHFGLRQVAGIGLEALLLAFLLFYVVQNAASWSGRLLNAAWLRHIGLISYSLYLWQQVFDGSSTILKHHQVLKFLLILPIAELSYFGVEKTSTQLRDWYLARRRSHAPAQVST